MTIQRARNWIANYNRGKYRDAFEAGSSLSGSGGRAVAKGNAPAAEKERRAASTRKEAVPVEPDGVGGIAAAMRERKRSGRR